MSDDTKYTFHVGVPIGVYETLIKGKLSEYPELINCLERSVSDYTHLITPEKLKFFEFILERPDEMMVETESQPTIIRCTVSKDTLSHAMLAGVNAVLLGTYITF